MNIFLKACKRSLLIGSLLGFGLFFTSGYAAMPQGKAVGESKAQKGFAVKASSGGTGLFKKILVMALLASARCYGMADVGLVPMAKVEFVESCKMRADFVHDFRYSEAEAAWFDAKQAAARETLCLYTDDCLDNPKYLEKADAATALLVSKLSANKEQLKEELSHCEIDPNWDLRESSDGRFVMSSSVFESRLK